MLRYLNAVQVTTGKRPAAIIFEACLDAYAPELRIDAPPSYDRRAYHGHKPEIAEQLMTRIRGYRVQRGQSASALIEDAVVGWLDRNVARVVTDPTNGIEWAVTHEEAAKRDAAWAKEQEQSELQMQAELAEARRMGEEADARDFAEAESLTVMTGTYHEPITYTSLKRLREAAASEGLTLEQYAVKYPRLAERIAEHEDQLHRPREDATMPAPGEHREAAP